MAGRSQPHFAIALASLVALVACESSVVGGGGLGGGGGAGGGASTGDPSTTAASTSDTSTGDVGATVGSSGSGELPSEVEGVIVPRDADEVDFLLGNSPQSCEAPQLEPPCASGDRWLARMNLPRTYLAPGTYPLNTGEIGLGVEETFDGCSGWGMRGWSGEPAWLTVDSIDAAHAVITIEGAYPDVDGTWDVPLCGGVGPA